MPDPKETVEPDCSADREGLEAIAKGEAVLARFPNADPEPEFEEDWLERLLPVLPAAANGDWLCWVFPRLMNGELCDALPPKTLLLPNVPVDGVACCVLVCCCCEACGVPHTEPLFVPIPPPAWPKALGWPKVLAPNAGLPKVEPPVSDPAAIAPHPHPPRIQISI